MATESTQMYSNSFSDAKLYDIPIKLRGLVAQNSLDQMYIVFQDRVVPGAELEEGEKIGVLKPFSGFQQNQNTDVSQQTYKVSQEIPITSPCKAKIEEIYCSSNSIVAAENNNGIMAPKYILSFSCLDFPEEDLRTNKKDDSDGLIEVSIISKENSLVVDVPDSESVQEGTVLLGIWLDNLVFLRYEATKPIQNLKTAYPKTQMISHRFQRGVTLVMFEIEQPLASQNIINDNNTDYLSQIEPLKENSIPNQEQTEKDDINKEVSVGGFEGDQSIQPLDASPTNLDETLENDHFENQETLNNFAQPNKDELQEIKSDSIVHKDKIQPIEIALDNSAVTYSIIMRNQLKKSKLHNLNQNFDLLNQKAKWIVRAPCPGVITTKTLTPSIKRISQGTVYAYIECSSKKGKTKKGSASKGQEIPLIMPFSVKIIRIKANLQETQEKGLYSAQVSKNQSILSGKLIKESKDIPAHLIFGKFQLVVAPCSGTLGNTLEVGKSVKKRDSIFSVECTEPGKDSVMYGLTTKPGLVTKVFRENRANVKEGEAIAIVRNNWKILTSPCDGLLIYTNTPGLAKIGTNIAVVVCNDNKFKRKNIQATKNFMILENILPNPSFVSKKQPLIVVDAARLNWDLSDDLDDSNTIMKTYSPSNTRMNIKNSKLPSNIIIQNVVSPCNGNLLREQELKIGSQIGENTTFAKIKCNRKKSYSLSSNTSAIILQNSVYEQIGGEIIHDYEPDNFQISKGDSILQIMFIHNVKHHIIASPCDGYGYTFNSAGNKVTKGKYFAAIQCKEEDKSKKTQKIKAVKDMNIVSSYIYFKKKFFKGDPLFIMVESN
ncbi:uncharacterized protein cubi_02656 [Cryptosporidium ubiquitum]|uniref:Uncharacterized protein n=1 Tax=Cryptosporidium ubiquitum TaxID=857276 RepID=A0A1J4MK96_9CRYT|nr:uncharacterized protein cubi_02656 [Cryptosporidium ubiquitum]OII73444.1 hypothetical protein cubi_02656 [Cryptosporidium ubiquitum]